MTNARPTEVKASVLDQRRNSNRKQLVHQFAAALRTAGLDVGILQGENTHGLHHRVVVASIDTIHARNCIFDDVALWSCVSAQGIESFEPPAGVREVIVFADNDANFAGQAAAYRVAHRLKLRGFEVEVVIPLESGDWLDELLRRRDGAQDQSVP